ERKTCCLTFRQPSPARESSERPRETSKASVATWLSISSANHSERSAPTHVHSGGFMKSLLKLLAHIGKAIGISSPSDNARAANVRTAPSWKQKQSAQASASSGTPRQPGA